jgi:hypothetical protein
MQPMFGTAALRQERSFRQNKAAASPQEIAREANVFI